MAGNGKKPPRPTKRDLQLATAIATALAPEFAGLREGLAEVRAGLDEVRVEVGGVKAELSNVANAVSRVENEVRQLRDGAVGIGRMTALEARVTELERKQR